MRLETDEPDDRSEMSLKDISKERNEINEIIGDDISLITFLVRVELMFELVNFLTAIGASVN